MPCGSICQDAMYQLHYDRSLSNGRRDALHTAPADIAHGEYPWDGGLEQVRPPAKRPPRFVQFVGHEIGASLDKASAIECDAALQPLRIGIGSSHGENMPDRVCSGLSGFAI